MGTSACHPMYNTLGGSESHSNFYFTNICEVCTEAKETVEYEAHNRTHCN